MDQRVLMVFDALADLARGFHGFALHGTHTLIGSSVLPAAVTAKVKPHSLHSIIHRPHSGAG
jgi:hypothetical protein